MRLGEIAERLGCKLEGDATLEITGVAGIEEASAGELTFLANRKYRPALARTHASAILVDRDAESVEMAVLRSPNPYLDFARAIELFHPTPQYPPGIHPTAVVAKSALVGSGAHVGPYCYVDEDVEIGRRAVLHSFVTIYRGVRIGDDFFAHAHACVREQCRIGDRVLLQNGVVVGSDGFGFARQEDGRWYKMRQAGISVVEDDVEIQAHSAIDRATVGADPHRARNEDRQLRAGRPRLQGRRGYGALRTGWARRNYASREPLHSCGTGGRGGASDDWRRRNTDCAKWRADGHSTRGGVLRISRDGQSRVEKIGRGVQPTAGTADRTRELRAEVARLRAQANPTDENRSTRPYGLTPSGPRRQSRWFSARERGGPFADWLRGPRSASRRLQSLRRCAERGPRCH